MVGIDTQVLGFRSGVDIGAEENEVPALGFFIGNHFLDRRLGVFRTGVFLTVRDDDEDDLVVLVGNAGVSDILAIVLPTASRSAVEPPTR